MPEFFLRSPVLSDHESDYPTSRSYTSVLRRNPFGAAAHPLPRPDQEIEEFP